MSDTFVYSCTVTGSVSGCTTPSTSHVAAYATVTRTVNFTTGANGTGFLTLYATGSNGTGQGGYTITVGTGGGSATPQVTPKDSNIAVAASASLTQSFRVTNSGTASGTFNLTATCVSSETSCPTSLSPVTLAASAYTDVSVSYTSGSGGTTGKVFLKATLSGGTAKDSGWVNVTSVSGGGSPSAPTFSLANSDSLLARDLCLTIAAGSQAASECGDLRIVHALPSIRTMSKVRTPTVIYNSQHAKPTPLIAANISLPSGGAPPDTVSASVVVTVPGSGTRTWVRKWPGGNWTAGGPARRITATLDSFPLASSAGTTIYSYTVDVANCYNGGSCQHATIQSGKTVVVDRSASFFGAGWWMAGVEQLNPTTMVWTSGDGSVRQYIQDPSNGNLYRAPSVTQPDSIVRDPGTGNFTRYVSHGTLVVFNSAGQHVSTVNRLGHTTTFGYTSGRLSSITVPPGGSDQQYTFTYNSDSTFLIATAPSAGTRARTDTLRLSRLCLTSYPYTCLTGRRMDRINDLNGTVTFGYNDELSTLVGSRTNKRNFLTGYAYDGAQKLNQVTVDSAGYNPWLITYLESAESRGSVGTSIIVDSAYAKITGPRTDTTVITKFWVDRFGSPLKIQNALGYLTSLTRGNATFPGLVTQAQDPHGFVTRAHYDSRGRPDTVTAVSPYGGSDAVTSYGWDNTWDFVTSVRPPLGQGTTFQYDATTGNRQWQQVGNNSARRITFSYDATCKLLSNTLDAGALAPDTIVYDATMCNVATMASPRGFRTTMLADNLGRDTLVTSPIDSVRSSTSRVRRRTVYDVMSRDSIVLAWGPQQTSSFGWTYGPSGGWTVPAETLTVQKRFDAEGNLTSLSRSAQPDTNHISTMTSQWVFDPANRLIEEDSPNGGYEGHVLDPAGNPVKIRTRRGDTLRLSYDALNRVRSRARPAVAYSQLNVMSGGVSFNGWSLPRYTGGTGYTVPGDTTTFTYDDRGFITAANNADAHIARTVWPSGQVKDDTLHIRTYAPLSGGGSFNSHVYVLSYSYDLNGRRTMLQHPSNVAPVDSLSVLHTQQSYAYEDTTGLLSTVTNVFGDTYSYRYDLAGRQTRIGFPGGVSERQAYNENNALVTRADSAANSYVGTWGGFATSLLHRDSLFFDGRGKNIEARTLIETARNGYSALGTLVDALDKTNNVQTRLGDEETYVVDALGNQRLAYLWTFGSDTSYTAQPPRTLWYGAASAREDSSGVDNAHKNFNYFDNAGNAYQAFTNQSTGLGEYRTAAASFFDAEQRLRAFAKRSCYLNSGTNTCNYVTTVPITDRQVWEEYRYDAFGRRVMMRSRSDSSCTTQCFSSLQRFVWDGSSLLYELRYPGGDSLNASPSVLERESGPVHDPSIIYGRVAYTHGLGIDQPLDLIRMEYSSAFPYPLRLSPHANWRGMYDLGSFNDGRREHCTAYPPGVGGQCVGITWPADHDWSQYFLPISHDNRTPELSWMGGLIKDQRDESGLYYKRSRYYDPQQLRFTQEDPAGVAGSLNSYGFANGDPVSYKDPFGEKVCFKGRPDQVSFLKGALEAATRTHLTVDKGNCVESFTRDANSKGFEKVQEGLQHLVFAADTFNVRFSYSRSEFNPANRDIQLYDDWNGRAYPAMVHGKCVGGQVTWSQPGQVLAHELEHAFNVGFRREPYGLNRSAEEARAMIWENTYNAANGLTPRCGY